MASKKIFFSYSWNDNILASRLHDYLIKSGLSVWRDQIDGEITSDFRKEYLKAIDECDDFLILDSINYRHKSNWCIDEIEHFLRQQNNYRNRRLIVLLADEPGAWRTEFRNAREKTVFGKINLYKYQRLYHSSIYDNESIFQSALEHICTLYDNKFTLWDEFPEIQDLNDEIYNYKQHTLTENDIKIIQYEYYIIRHLKNIGSNTTIEHCRIWLKDCRDLSLKLFLPRFIYALLLSTDDISECVRQFQKLIELFPTDPRGFRGLGGILSICGKYDEAIESLLEALRLMNLEGNIRHKKTCEAEVLRNLGQLFLNIENMIKALSYLNKASDILISKKIYDISVFNNKYFCLKKLSFPQKEILSYILDLITTFPTEPEPYCLAAFEYNQSIERKNDAIQFMEKAYNLNPKPEYAYHLMKIQKNEMPYTYILSFSNSILARPSITPDDDYYKGAICYFILNKKDAAQKYYDLIKDKSEYPEYEEFH